MSAVSPIAYLRAQHTASLEASTRLVDHLTQAGLSPEAARDVVARHMTESAERLLTENKSILDSNVSWAADSQT